MRGRVATALAATLVASAGCSATPEPNSTADDGAPLTVAPPVIASSAPVSAPPPVSSASASASGAAAAPPKSDPSTFACGATRCRAGAETCCAAGDTAECVPSVNDGPPGAVGSLKTQWDRCDALQTQASRHFDRLARCDESDDCSGGQLCCEQFLFSGSNGLAECTPLPKSGESPCDFGETCIAGGCRLPGTSCIDGRCRKTPTSMRCDQATCSGSAPYCCGDPSVCTADATCGGPAAASGAAGPGRVACTKDDDCVKGERCLDNHHGTLCIRAYPDPDHAPWICTRDAECKAACNGFGGGKPVCATSTLPWLKACTCD